MYSATATPDEIVSSALEALRSGCSETLGALERIPTPIYTTDADGRITWFNSACVRFAGRTPEVGHDSWCVTWKLYSEDGTALPHEECPMAVAIREGRPVRDVEAIAERPDGGRVSFRPFPTPLLDDDGKVVGAVNLLLDTTGSRQAKALKTEAVRCRRLAQWVNDPKTVSTLTGMAEEYEQKARTLQTLN